MSLTTITHIAKPRDDRCKWWQAILQPEYLTPSYLEERIPMLYLRAGADLELADGVFLIDSEAVHHRKDRGYSVRLGVAFGEKIHWIYPTMKIKQHIKRQSPELMKGSGDVAGCIRIAIYLSKRDDIPVAFEELKALHKTAE